MSSYNEPVSPRSAKDIKRLKELEAENKKLQMDNDEQREKITCLESDSHNEVSQAEYDELKDEIKELKDLLEKIEREFISLEDQDKYGSMISDCIYL